jgi:hypothetical protein
VVEVVVVEVVVSGMPSHGGSVGSVQEQFGFVLHSLTTACLQALKAMPVKAPHAELLSSEQRFGLHFPAALASETKTPAPSATAANVTAAPLMIVIVKPPYGNSVAQHQWSAARPVAATATEPTTVARTLARHLNPIIPKPPLSDDRTLPRPFGRPKLMSSSRKLRPRSPSRRTPAPRTG